MVKSLLKQTSGVTAAQVAAELKKFVEEMTNSLNVFDAKHKVVHKLAVG